MYNILKSILYQQRAQVKINSNIHFSQQNAKNREG